MARNDDGYTGMLILATVAMTIGVLALAIEATEYGWEQKAAAGAKANIPALPRFAAAESNSPTTVTQQSPKPLIPTPVAGARSETPAAPAAGEARPAVAADSKPKAADVAETKPASQPQTPVVEGPIPSPLVIPNRVRPNLNLPTTNPAIPGVPKTGAETKPEPASTPAEPGDPVPSPIRFPRK